MGYLGKCAHPHSKTRAIFGSHSCLKTRLQAKGITHYFKVLKCLLQLQFLGPPNKISKVTHTLSNETPV